MKKVHVGEGFLLKYARMYRLMQFFRDVARRYAQSATRFYFYTTATVYAYLSAWSWSDLRPKVRMAVFDFADVNFYLVGMTSPSRRKSVTLPRTH